MATETKTKNEITTKRKTLPELVNDPATLERLHGMLGKDARSFAQNILTVFNAPGGALQGCDAESIIAAASVSASINLSILPSLGHSCLVPYKDGDRVVAQWQIMWKGLVQLAHRTGQYERINLARVYDGQLVSHDEFKGVVELDAKRRKSDRVQGYYFYFKLKNGASFEFYWSAKKCVEHGLRYSKSFQAGSGKWTEDPAFKAAGTVRKWLDGKEHFLTEGSGADAMSAKTVVKNELNKWGPLETRIKEIVQDFDQASVGADGRPSYIDTTAVPTELPKSYVAPPMNNPDGSAPSAAEKIATGREFAVKQGIQPEQFDAWLASLTGDDDAKAAAVRAAWQSVAKKERTAAQAFTIVATSESKDAQERLYEFKVGGAATADFDGDPDCYAIRDDGEPPVRHYTKETSIFESAKASKKDGGKLRAYGIMRVVGGKNFAWLTRLAD